MAKQYKVCLLRVKSTAIYLGNVLKEHMPDYIIKSKMGPVAYS
jgi:hypothetical protein